MDLKGLEGLVTTIQQETSYLADDISTKMKFLYYSAGDGIIECIKAGRYMAEFLGKGYAGALPHFNQTYFNHIFDFEGLELTKASVALDFIYGVGYIAASNLFVENGLASKMVGFELGDSIRTFLIFYGCVDIAEGIVRAGHVAYFGTPIGTLKNEVLGELAKSLSISQDYWNSKIRKIANSLKKDLKNFGDFFAFGLNYNLRFIGFERILEKIYE